MLLGSSGCWGRSSPKARPPWPTRWLTLAKPATNGPTSATHSICRPVRLGPDMGPTSVGDVLIRHDRPRLHRHRGAPGGSTSTDIGQSSRRSNAPGWRQRQGPKVRLRLYRPVSFAKATMDRIRRCRLGSAHLGRSPSPPSVGAASPYAFDLAPFIHQSTPSSPPPTPAGSTTSAVRLRARSAWVSGDDHPGCPVTGGATSS
jgi:hypothetical protein